MNNNKTKITKAYSRISKQHILAAAIMSGTMAQASADMLLAETDDTKLFLYGHIDAGVLYQDKVSTDGQKRTAIETSGLTPSILGFKASRTLRNDWTAFFNLETHFDVDTGNFHGSGDAANNEAGDGDADVFFRRQSNLGLSADWGTIIVGRQYGPGLLAHLATEPRAYKEQFSGVYTWAYSQLFNSWNLEDDTGDGDGRNQNNDVGIFFENAIQYRNKIAGVDFGIMYAAGEKEGDQKAGSVWAVGANYAFPMLTLSGSYQVMRDDDTAEELIKHRSFGLAAPVAEATLKANYMSSENSNAAGESVLDVDSISIGVDLPWAPQQSATLAYYMNEASTPVFDDVATNTLILSNDYQLSDSTIFYVQAAFVDSDDMDVVSQYATSVVATPAPVDEQTRLLNAGLNVGF